MKVALVFLAVFVGTSYQQGYYLPYYGAPHYPVIYAPHRNAYPMLQGQDYGQNLFLQNVEGRSNQVKENAENNARAGVLVSIPNPFSSLTSSLLTTSTYTATEFSTTTTTATKFSEISCAASSIFTSTTACRRRRAIFEDSGIEESIAASPKEEIEASVIPEEKMMREVVEPELLSSQVEAEEEKGLFLQASKTARFLNSVTVQTTTTKSTTVTIVAFTTSSFTKTLALATQTSVLVCLPSGIIVCI